MKFTRTLVLFLLTILLTDFNLFAQENQVETGYLKLLSNYDMVAIDGEVLKITESTTMNLTPGRHTIRYIYRVTDREWKPPFVLQFFNIISGDTLTIDLKERISFNINSKPSGAEIHLEEVSLGTSPRSLSILIFGNQILTLKKDKYQDKSISITEALKENPNINVSLTPLVELEQQTETEQILVGVSEKHRLRTKIIKYSLAGVTVGAAIAGLVFKEQADDAFKAYERSANRERIEFFFDRSESRDTLARISFLVSEAALLTTVYLFIKDVGDSRSYQKIPIEVSLDPYDKRRMKVGYKFRY